MKIRRGDVVWTDYYEDAYDLYGTPHSKEHFEKWVVVYTKQHYVIWSKKNKRKVINDCLVMCLTTNKFVRMNSKYLRTDPGPNKTFVPVQFA